LAIAGINVGPLLASAGILGVAVGFGAQTLVKDYISGIFLILEDQFGLGDEVEIGTIHGTVVDVALRVTQVRDSDGRLWYIRNGEILNVANHNRKLK
jgi:small conductance mechanosensitive channel